MVRARRANPDYVGGPLGAPHEDSGINPDQPGARNLDFQGPRCINIHLFMSNAHLGQEQKIMVEARDQCRRRRPVHRPS